MPSTLRNVAHFDGTTPDSARAARRFVGACLHEAAADADWWELLTGELATNVVVHAQTDFDVVVAIDRTRLRVEVHDGSAATDAFRALVESPPVSTPVGTPSGRGWLLVGATAAHFGLDDLPDGGKAVWFEVPVRRR